MSLGTTTAGAPMPLDVGRLIGSHACIVANSGGGKSGLIRRLLEVTHGRVQHIVLDGEDEFYTLRERYDYVIAGGDGGDVPATVESAEGLALAALTHGFSLIAQLNDLGFLGAPDFIGRFLNAMVNAPRHLWHPVLVVVDEAQRFVPRQGQTAATEGVRALLAQGRKRGFTAILAGTKFTDIDPSARGGVNNWLLGRVGQAVDRNTMADQLGFTPKEGRERLGSMEPRNFWAFGPALSREAVLFHVADVETTPIHAGQAKVPTPPAPEALRAILAGLAQVEVAAEPAKNIPGNIPTWPDQRAEVVALQAVNAGLVGDRDHWKRIADTRGALNERARAALQANGDEIPAPSGGDPAPLPRREERAAPQKAPRPSGAAPADLPPRHRRILNAIAWCATFLGRTGVPRGIVAWVADISAKSSSYANDISALRTGGLIDYPASGEIALTSDGSAAAEWPDTPPTREALRDAVASQLAPRQRAFLSILWAEERLTREALAEKAGVSATSSSFANDISRLRTLGIIDYPAPGQVSLGGIFGVLP